MIRIKCAETVWYYGEINDPELEAAIMKYAEENECDLGAAVRDYAYTEETCAADYNMWAYVDSRDSELDWIEATPCND